MRTRDNDDIKAIKAMLGEWGYHKRVEWRQNGIGYKSPAFILMIKPSHPQFDCDDPRLLSFNSSIISMKSHNFGYYQVVRRIYADEMIAEDVARQLGTTKRTVHRRLQSACAYLRSNWSYMSENTGCSEIQFA